MGLALVGGGGLPPHISGMLDPSIYPHPVDEVELRQTHASWILFAGDRVYKVKKPVDLGYLDHTALGAREFACQQELWLNKRLTTEVYLEIIPISHDDNGTRLRDASEQVDVAVVMRRLDDEQRLDRLADRLHLSEAMLDDVAAHLASFHLRADSDEAIAESGRIETVAGNWQENFEQVEPHVGVTIGEQGYAAIRTWVEDQMERLAHRFDLRAVNGWVRDLHGDVRGEAVFIEDAAIQIIDCIEFNERFRHADVASEVAFLAMDLEVAGHGTQALTFVAAYLRHLQDAELASMLPFWTCYRAFVRGKVASQRLEQPDLSVPERDATLDLARRHFGQAWQITQRTRLPRLLIMMGAAGSGKSHLARALAVRLGAVLLQSDVIRKRMAGLSPTDRVETTVGGGIYDREHTERTYAEMLQQARHWLVQDEPVILDGTFLSAYPRESAARVAAQLQVPVHVVWCDAAEDVVMARMQRRMEDEAEVSDALWDVHQFQRQLVEPPEEFAAEQVIHVDTDAPTEVLVEQVERWLAGSS